MWAESQWATRCANLVELVLSYTFETHDLFLIDDGPKFTTYAMPRWRG